VAFGKEKSRFVLIGPARTVSNFKNYQAVVVGLADKTGITICRYDKPKYS